LAWFASFIAANLLGASLLAQCGSAPLMFSGQNVPSGTYQAAQFITADAGGGSATTTISGGSNVSFQAGTSITLLPNFHAAPGSSFQASVANPSGPPFVFPSSLSMLGGGGNGCITVTVAPGISWTASSSSSWTNYASWDGSGSSAGPPNPTVPGPGAASFYWVPDGNNGATDNYTVSYTANGATASVTFTVAAPTMANPLGGAHANINPGKSLTSQANLTDVVTPPEGFNGTASWIQVLSSVVTFFYSQGGGTLAACSPSVPGPPWLDTSNPYPIAYPAPLAPNQYGFYDTPNVSFAIAQADGAFGVTRQFSSVVYLMWTPQIAGTVFEVPLFAIPWGFSDFANLTNGAWETGGTITQYPALSSWQTNYPTWAGTATAQNATGACTAITMQ
jgi:hypothetical protein